MSENTEEATTKLAPIEIPEYVSDLALEYRRARNTKTKHGLITKAKEAKETIFAGPILTTLFGLGTWGLYVLTIWAWSGDNVEIGLGFLGLFGLVGGLISATFGIITALFTASELFEWLICTWKLRKFKNRDRTKEEEKIFTDKLAKMAYRITSSGRAVNALIEEITLHEEMLAEGIEIFDHVRAKKILVLAHKKVNRELRRIITLLKYREKRESRSIDLSEISALLDESSVGVLSEVKAEIEVDPDAVFTALQETLALDDVNAELGEVDAIIRKRESGKPMKDDDKKIAAAQAQSTRGQTFH